MKRLHEYLYAAIGISDSSIFFFIVTGPLRGFRYGWMLIPPEGYMHNQMDSFKDVTSHPFSHSLYILLHINLPYP